MAEKKARERLRRSLSWSPALPESELIWNPPCGYTTLPNKDQRCYIEVGEGSAAFAGLTNSSLAWHSQKCHWQEIWKVKLRTKSGGGVGGFGAFLHNLDTFLDQNISVSWVLRSDKMTSWLRISLANIYLIYWDWKMTCHYPAAVWY